MRIPEKPPDSVYAETLGFGVGNWLSHSWVNREFQRIDRYLHWEDFKRRQPPEGISIENAWSLLKSVRGEGSFIQLRPNPHVAYFHFSVPPPIFARLREVDMLFGGNLQTSFHEELRDSEQRDRYYLTSLAEEAIRSSQLEGAVVTREIARDMIRTGRKPMDMSERMILNNYRTMQQLSIWKDRELDEELLLEIHTYVTEGTLDKPDAVGRFRRDEEDVSLVDEEDDQIIHRPPEVVKMSEDLQAMYRFTNKEEMRGYEHPVLKSIILHFWLAWVHPFYDGNGRTARALFYWSMLKHGYWLVEFISISQIILKAPKQYSRAFLYTETDDNDLNYFIFHQLGCLLEAFKSLQAYLERKKAEQDQSQLWLGHHFDYNNRQVALLRHALKHRGFRYMVEGHKNSHGITTETARRDLLQLVQDGLLLRKKRGKAYAYVAQEDLPDRLNIKSRRPLI